jgi:nucleoside-diphosphate kinase
VTAIEFDLERQRSLLPLSTLKHRFALENSMNRTLILVKPDGLQRGLAGEIISRFERRGLQLIAMKLIQMSPDLAGRHYAEHEGKPFYEDLVSYITSGPVVAMVWKGAGAVAAARATMGVTRPVEAGPGTIRGDFALDVGRNLVHGSDSEASAQREIALFFEPHEFVEWEQVDSGWINAG